MKPTTLVYVTEHATYAMHITSVSQLKRETVSEMMKYVRLLDPRTFSHTCQIKKWEKWLIPGSVKQYKLIKKLRRQEEKREQRP